MSDLKIELTLDEIYQIYFWGASEGQLLMEEERAGEEIFDAVVCYCASRKYNVPSTPVRRRQLHSEKWFAAMRKDKAEFIRFLCQKIKEVQDA